MQLFLLIIHHLFVSLTGSQSFSADGPFINTVFDERIRTIQLYREGWNLSYPVIRLNGNEKLSFQFDLLDDISETYYYTFIHCDKDWNRSDINTTEFLNGFPDNPIEDIKQSFNTTVKYKHYSLIFPNDRVSFKLSGNYILYVYPADDPGNPAVIQRFILTEDIAGIEVEMHRPQTGTDINTGQQIDFTVNITAVHPQDPYRDISSSVLQNGRWDVSRVNMKPDFFNNNEIKYSSLSDRNIFSGGNEFRYFDIRSIKYLGENTRNIDFMSGNYHVFITLSEDSESKPYFYWQDFNGKYYIATREGKDADTDADYVNVYFSVPSHYEINGGNIFVAGGLTRWTTGPENKMTYNPGAKQYECTILLKQGWYNYSFLFKKKGVEETTYPIFEGSHYETENDYLIIVYYRNPRSRYDRVIGTTIANTLNKLSY